MSDFAEIELTDQQEQIIDWLMGAPIISNWNDPGEMNPRQLEDWEKEFDKPELEAGVFKVPKSPEFIDVLTRPCGDLQRYADMAKESLTQAEASGIQRTVNNLREKLSEVVEDE